MDSVAPGAGAPSTALAVAQPRRTAAPGKDAKDPKVKLSYEECEELLFACRGRAR